MASKGVYWLEKVRDFLFWVFNKCFKPVVGKGIGQRLPFAGNIFLFLYRSLSPGIILSEFQGVKLYLDPKSSVARTLLIKGSYEKGTTRLFRDLIKEGMVILDIGANIGYYSLIAARLVGEKGKVFAFEPGPDNFSLLIKNIEVNGFTNIIPVQKAVSNKIGRDRLFLSSDPAWHSMYERNEKASIDVEVTTIDEFVQKINCPVHLIKMDVEGAEMKVLEGMLETIKRNPTLKVITEFSTGQLQKSGCSPMEFLRKLVDCGFKIHVIDEEQEEVAEAADIDSTWKICQRKGTLNLFCER